MQSCTKLEQRNGRKSQEQQRSPACHGLSGKRGEIFFYQKGRFFVKRGRFFIKRGNIFCEKGDILYQKGEILFDKKSPGLNCGRGPLSSRVGSSPLLLSENDNDNGNDNVTRKHLQ